ncbi:MAG: response regulator transcription factor [Limisphaerales bacterium]
MESLHRELHKACELTGREADVGYYLSLGKTNPEISMILEIAERTVQKHLENAFPKLGVENRQAAIVFIFDFFKRLHSENME